MKPIFICLIFGFLFGIINTSSHKELPKEFTRCKIGPDFTKCMVDVINDVLPTLSNGNKELGIPKLEPFNIKTLKFDSNDKGPVNLKQLFRNVVIPHLTTNAIVTDIRLDLEKHEMQFEYLKPTLDLKADYKLSGRILILPIEGTGKFTLKFNNLRIKQKAKYEEIVKDGEKYFHFISVETKAKPEKMITNFENLFKGDVELGKTTNEFINENWYDIWNELEPDYAQAFGAISLRILNDFFATIPVENIFIF